MEPADLQAAGCHLVANVVRSAGAASLKVMGTSMLPAIRPGDVLTIQRTGAGELEPGQVILYARNRGLVAHRILGISNEFVYTRGDSMASPDLPVPREEIVGRVETILRGERAMDLRWTACQRATAWILRRSETFMKIYLRVSARGRRLTAGVEAARA